MTRTNSLLTLSFIFLPIASIFAEDVSNLDEVSEIILVTAHRTSVSDLITPYSYTLIDDDELRLKNFRTTPEIFRQIPGVLLQKTAHGQGSPYIRGFTGYQNIMLVDGIRLNNSAFRSGPNQYWNTVDPFSIQRFEVIKGPSSSMYGSDGIGGTVNSITLTPDLQSTHTNIMIRGASGERSGIGYFDSNLVLGERDALRVGGSLKNFGDLETGQGKLKNSGYDEQTFNAKWLSQLNAELSLTAAHFLVHQQDVPRTHRTIFSQSYAGTTIGSELQRNLDQRRELSYLRLKHSTTNSFYDELSTTVSYHQQSESRDRVRTRNRTDFQGFGIGTLGLNVQFTNNNSDSSLVYGVDIYQDSVDSFSSHNDIQGPVADDASYTSSGAFVEWRTDFGEKWQAVAGARFDHFDVDAKKVQDPQSGEAFRLTNSWSNLASNIRLIRELKPNKSMIFAGVAQGFRAPNLSDLTRFDSARSNEFEIPAPDLDSEDFVAIEWGYRHRDTSFQFDIAAYYTFIHDQILRFPTGQLNAEGEIEISKANVGDGYVTGIETSSLFKINPHWRLTLAASYMTGKSDQFPTSTQQAERDYISRLMPLMGNISIRYQPQLSPWFAELQLLMAARADRLSQRDMGDTDRIPVNGTPGYSVFNIFASYRLSDALNINASIENIFDKNYRIHGSGQNEVGRNFVVSVSLLL